MAAAARRQQKSWVRRRRRRIRITILLILFVVLAVGAGFVVYSTFPYEQADLTEMFTVEYDGYDTKGTAETVICDAKVDELLLAVREDYDNALLPLKKVEPEDYAKFRSSLTATVTPSGSLANGSVINMTVMYDKSLADKLKIDVTSVTKTITVDGLVRVTTISNDQLFQDVSVSFSGISPKLTPTVINNSTHPVLKDVVYEIMEPKEFYAEGDDVEVCAIFDKNAVLTQQFVIDESQYCSKIYTATSDAAYVSDYNDITSDIIQAAITAGNAAFVNANEYGVRIFCEAHLVPVYINKQATFNWGSPRALSAYFKTVFPENAGKLGFNYNDLDIIYEVSISQADGKSCKSYCVVRFSDFIKNADGSISYDFSNPKIMSASYYSSRVKQNVVDFYVGSYDVNKIY